MMLWGQTVPVPVPTVEEIANLSRNQGISTTLVIVAVFVATAIVLVYFHAILRPDLIKRNELKAKEMDQRINMDTKQQDLRITQEKRLHDANIRLYDAQAELTRRLGDVLPDLASKVERVVDMQGELVKANQEHAHAQSLQGKTMEGIVAQHTAIVTALNAQTLSLQEHRRKLETDQRDQIKQQDSTIRLLEKIVDSRYDPMHGSNSTDTGQRRRCGDKTEGTTGEEWHG